MINKLLRFLFERKPTSMYELVKSSEVVTGNGHFETKSYECPVKGCTTRRKMSGIKMHIAKCQDSAHREFYNKHTRKRWGRKLWLLE